MLAPTVLNVDGVLLLIEDPPHVRRAVRSVSELLDAAATLTAPWCAPSEAAVRHAVVVTHEMLRRVHRQAGTRTTTVTVAVP